MTIEEFANLVEFVLDAGRRPNPEQWGCLAHDPAVLLLIVAGPGSGKTTVLVLRALRRVLVDRIAPERIMITTFTRKTTKEIRTRLIELGTPLIEAALDELNEAAWDGGAAFLREADVNRFVTGTLDSLCEKALAGARELDELPLVVVEAFAANQMLARRGEVYDTSRRLGQPFLDYLALYTNTGDPPQTVSVNQRGKVAHPQPRCRSLSGCTDQAHLEQVEPCSPVALTLGQL